MELCWREREEEGEREKKEGKRRLTNKQTVECGGGREERRAYHDILRLILMIHFCFGKPLKLAN